MDDTIKHDNNDNDNRQPREASGTDDEARQLSKSACEQAYKAAAAKANDMAAANTLVVGSDEHIDAIVSFVFWSITQIAPVGTLLDACEGLLTQKYTETRPVYGAIHGALEFRIFQTFDVVSSTGQSQFAILGHLNAFAVQQALAMSGLDVVVRTPAHSEVGEKSRMVQDHNHNTYYLAGSTQHMISNLLIRFRCALKVVE